MKIIAPAILRNQTITQAAIIIAIITFISKFFGLFREILVAKYFGATEQTDAFLVAMIIPISILGLFATGFSTLIIPYYLEKKAKSEEAAKQFVNSSFIVWGGFFIIISILIYIFAPACVHLVAYAFRGERFILAVTLTRYLVLSGLFTVLVGMFTGIFQAEKQFFFPIFISFLGNVSLVFSLLYLHRYLGLNSWTVGQLLNAFISFFVLFFVLFRRYKFFQKIYLRNINWIEMRQFASLLLPLVISSGISMLNQVIDKNIASGLDPGSISALNFAIRILGIPITLLAAPISTAIFPTFSELAITNYVREEYEFRLQKIIEVSFYLVIPSTFFLYFMATPIVRLFFERGEFDPKATALTSFVLQMYVIGLFSHAVSPILTKVFYSFKNTATPLLVSAISLGLNIILNIVLSRIFGAAGIALATSLAMSLNFVLLTIFLRKQLIYFSCSFAAELIKIILGSIPIGLICHISNLIYFQNLSASTFSEFISMASKVFIVWLISTIVFIQLSQTLQIKSFTLLKSIFLSGIKRLTGK